MFCPKCGDEMTRVNSAWACVRGNMPLSTDMSDAFTEVFLNRIRSGRYRQTTPPVGGKWYCPGCGVPMVQTVGSLKCPKCRETLGEVLFPLVEFHPPAGAQWTSGQRL